MDTQGASRDRVGRAMHTLSARAPWKAWLELAAALSGGPVVNASYTASAVVALARSRGVRRAASRHWFGILATSCCRSSNA